MNPNYDTLPVYWKSSPAITVLTESNRTRAPYWNHHPANTVLEVFLKLGNTHHCLGCKSAQVFTLDSNGTGNNVRGCFKCKSCKQKVPALKFWTDYLKLSPSALASAKPTQPAPVTAPDTHPHPLSDDDLMDSDDEAAQPDQAPDRIPESSQLSPLQLPTAASNSPLYSPVFSQPAPIQPASLMNWLKRPRVESPPPDARSKFVTIEVLDAKLSVFADTILARLQPQPPTSEPASSALDSLRAENEKLKQQLELQQQQIQDLIDKSSASAPSSAPAVFSASKSKKKSVKFNFQPSESFVSVVGSSSASASTLPQSPKSTSSPSSSAPKKPSFADVAKKFAKSGSKEEVSKMQSAVRRLVGVKPPYTTTNAEVKHKISRVLINGFHRQPIRELKSTLRELDFHMGHVHSMEFTSKSTVEFTMSESYIHSFVSKIRKIPQLTVLPKTNSRLPLDPKADEAIAKLVQESYDKRFQQAYDGSKRESYRAFLVDLADELGVPLIQSELPPPLSPAPAADDSEMVVDGSDGSPESI
jgi:hypothetical protein